MANAERPSVPQVPRDVMPVSMKHTSEQEVAHPVSLGGSWRRENPFNKVESEPDWLGDDMGHTF